MAGLWDELPVEAFSDPAKWLREERRQREDAWRTYEPIFYSRREPQPGTPAYMDRAY